MQTPGRSGARPRASLPLSEGHATLEAPRGKLMESNPGKVEATQGQIEAGGKSAPFRRS